MGYTTQEKVRNWDTNWHSHDTGLWTKYTQNVGLSQTWFSRTGSYNNSVVPRRTGPRPKRYIWKKVLLPIPFTYRKRVYDHNLNKWVTKTFTRDRYSWQKFFTPDRKKPKPTSLKINSLNYEKMSFKDLTPSGSINVDGYGSSWDPKRQRVWKYEGPIGYIGTTAPSGWGSGTLDRVQPNNYGSSSLFASYGYIIDRLEEAGLRKLYAKVKNQEVNLLNVIGERRQTMQMLADCIRRVSKALILMKKGRLQRAAGVLFPGNSSQLANDVLLFNFGIRPLLADVEGAAKHLASTLMQKETIVYKVVQKDRDETSQKFGSAHSLITRDQLLNIKTEVTVKHVIKVKIDNSGILDQAKRLGLLNLPSTLYELTPWSFAIDWLIPIGEWLNTYDAFVGLTVEEYHVTTVVKQQVMCVSTHDGITGEYFGFDAKTSGNVGVWVKDNMKIARVIKNNSIPHPPLPSLRDPVTTTRIVNSLALLRQLFH